jgi:enolase
MAFKITILRASTLDDLERAINGAFVEAAKDVRIEIDLAGGITYANDEYVVPVRVNAPHKRRFEEEEEDGSGE